jgi:glyoxylase-like metal-dependent hydrolase (beta-lactamase superfamily II)
LHRVSQRSARHGPQSRLALEGAGQQQLSFLGGERLTFAGDAVFPVGFDHPDWQNGFEHDPDEAVRVRVRLLREIAENGALLAATHLPFPSICRIAVEGDAFRCVPTYY